MPGEYPTCVFCDQPVDPRQHKAWSKVIGWTQTRASGGACAIKDRIELHQYAHGPCMKLHSDGVSLDQIKLFEDELP